MATLLNETMSGGDAEGARSDYADNFPNSRKVYQEGPFGIRVPFREISLSGGEPPLRVYDPSGPRGHDVNEGLPPIRRPWILTRNVDLTGRSQAVIEQPVRQQARAIPPSLLREPLKGRGTITQLHYARRGEITPEIEFAAIREGLPAEFVRAEVARGRAIIPAYINLPELEPMVIGSNLHVHINANIGNSAVY
jgi:phosphomethylpyrimidine synthase